MKQGIITLSVIVLIAALFLILPQRRERTQGSVFLNSTGISVPGERRSVSLKDGRGVIIHGSGATERTQVEVLTEHYMKLGESSVAVLRVSTGGTGVFYWLAVYREEGGSFVKTGEALLGDRIRVRYLRADEESVSVGITEYGAEQSFSEEPEIERELIYILNEGRLFTTEPD